MHSANRQTFATKAWESEPDYPLVKAVRALGLMRQALDLLDEAGARHAACQLQMAIDTLCPPE